MARIEDINGWIEIKGNPISKVGVFPYSGKQISDELEPDRIYQVYRPAEELSDPECMESFRLLPWIDDHVMLGKSSDGLTPPEKKGISGVIGEEIYFEAPYLLANLKVFSESLTKKIDENDKKELSIGYRCRYDIESGTFEGQAYEVVQRKIRGNHVASVDDGRSGPDVAVLDNFKFTLDTKELITVNPEMNTQTDVEMKPEVTLEALSGKLDALIAAIGKVINMEKAEAAGDEIPEGLVKDECVDKGMADEDTVEEVVDQGSEPKVGFDSAIVKSPFVKNLAARLANLESVQAKNSLSEINKRNKLAELGSRIVGTFDHSEMTTIDVAKYIMKKEGLTCEKGKEEATVAGYLAAALKPSKVLSAMDENVVESDQVNAFLNGGK